MSEFSQVAALLTAMTQLQLLMAFTACGAYVLAQCSLLEGRPRRLAWMAAASAAVAFVLQSGGEWPHALMLCAIAVGGLGVFVALAWLTSRWLGLARSSPVLAPVDGGMADDVDAVESASPAAGKPLPAARRPSPHLA